MPKAPAKIAIIAGKGALPEMIFAAEQGRDADPLVVDFGVADLDWAPRHACLSAQFEQPKALFDALKTAKVTAVCFAGAMARPSLRPWRMDAKFLGIAPKLLPALKGGDDGVLRVIADFFAAEGFAIIPAHDLISDAFAGPGVLGQHQPSALDKDDIARAQEIATAFGAVDTGQAVIVAQGLALGIETIHGTDAMLSFVASAPEARPDPQGAKGVLYKAAKPQQDRRMDMPAIGPATVSNAAKAGLAGIALEADAVMILDRQETVARADQAGLFLIGLPVGRPHGT